MKYLILMAQDEKVWPSLTPEQQHEYMLAHRAFGEALDARSANLAGEALDGVASATTLRHRDGKAEVTDGPFAETAEQLGGFYLIEAANLDEAVELCELLPHDYTIEIRPVITIDLPEAAEGG